MRRLESATPAGHLARLAGPLAAAKLRAFPENYIITTITASGCNESPQTRHLTLPGTPLAYAPRLDRQISLLLGNRRRNPVCRRPKPTPCPNDHALPDTQPAHSRGPARSVRSAPAGTAFGTKAAPGQACGMGMWHSPGAPGSPGPPGPVHGRQAGGRLKRMLAPGHQAVAHCCETLPLAAALGARPLVGAGRPMLPLFLASGGGTWVPAVMCV